MEPSASVTSITNCLFVKNNAALSGGAVYWNAGFSTRSYTDEEKKAKVKEAVENALRSAAEKYGGDLLDQIDIKDITAKRIEAMNVDELFAEIVKRWGEGA